jgi:hypothetical protein
MAKNTRAKSRDVTNPYETYTCDGWTWKVLKHNQSAEGERKNPYASVFCAVYSPWLHGEADFGNTYIKAIPGYNKYWDKEDEGK